MNDLPTYEDGLKDRLDTVLCVIREYQIKWEGDRVCGVLNDLDDELERLIK